MAKKKVKSKEFRKSNSQPEKRGRGRPATGRTRNIQVKTWMDEPEHAAIESAADRAGQTVGVWLRDVALDAAGYVPEVRPPSSDKPAET